MSAGYLQLLSKIDDFIRRYYLNKMVRGLIWWTAIFVISFLIFTVSEYYGYFAIVTRSIIFYGFIVTQLVLLWMLIGRHLAAYFRLGKHINHQQASVIIGQHFPQIKDRLLNTLELHQLAEENPEQRDLIEASIEQRINNFKPIPFIKAVNLGQNKKYLVYALVPIFVVLVMAFATPSILKQGSQRIINHQVFYKKKAPFQFNILNKNLSVRQGDDLSLEVMMSGEQIPAEVYLIDGAHIFKLDKKDIIHFSYDFKNLQNTKNYRLQAGEFSSDEFTVAVQAKPKLLSYSVNLQYPAYLRKAKETLKNPGDLTVPEGTIARFFVETEHVNKFLLSLNGIAQNAEPQKKNAFIVEHRLMKTGTYALAFSNADSPVYDSVSYALNIIKDQYPKIEVEEKPDSANVNVLYFIGKISDDYGFSQLKFHYQISKTSDAKRKGKAFETAIKFDKHLLQSTFLHAWPLKQVGILPGEEISYYFDVADNDGVQGAKHTRSATRIYRLPSKTEQLNSLEKSTESIQNKMEQAIRKAEKIQTETKKLSQDLLQQKNLDYEQKKRIDQLIAQKKELEKLVEDIQKEGKQNLEQSKELREQNEALLEKQKQIQDLFENVLDDKTKELLQNLQKLVEKNQKEMSQSELQKMQMDNKSLQKELDRILELYKKLALEQKLTNTIDKLQDLAKKQEQLSGNKSKPAEELKKEQQQLQKDFNDIKKDLKDVKKENELLENPQELGLEQKDLDAIDKDLDDAQQNLDKNQKQGASKSQRNASDKMQQLAQKLQSNMQGGMEQENMVSERQLRMILKNLLKTSFDQEKLMLDFSKANPGDPGFLKLGQKQLEIKENLKIVEDSLYSLSKVVPQIQATVNKEIQQINQQINTAIEQITEQQIAEANRSQQYALTGINNLALMLSEALQQLQNAMKNAKSGGKGGKSQPSLGQLSEMQKQLNQNMQKAKDAMQQQGIKPGQKGSKELSESLAKMAQQQQMIRQALQEINNNLNKDGKGSLGNLEKIMKQMEQTETDLVNRRITQEAITRQQEIQTRLLEAEKAEREREQDDKRESKAGKEFSPNYNLILEDYRKMKAKELQQIKTLPPTLNYFYRNKITEYFKTLNLGE